MCERERTKRRRGTEGERIEEIEWQREIKE